MENYYFCAKFKNCNRFNRMKEAIAEQLENLIFPTK